MGPSQSKHPLSTSASPDRRRSVFIEAWGKTPKGRRSMHFCMLVLNDDAWVVNEFTPGWTFDWGSMVDGKIMKTNAPCKVKSFGPVEYQKGVECKNKWKYAGYTTWTNDEIKKEMDEQGDHYDFIGHNCRDVTRLTMRWIQHMSAAERAQVRGRLDDKLGLWLEGQRKYLWLFSGTLEVAYAVTMGIVIEHANWVSKRYPNEQLFG